MQPVLGEMREVLGHRSSHYAVRRDAKSSSIQGGRGGRNFSSAQLPHNSRPALHVASICSAAMLPELSQEMPKCKQLQNKTKHLKAPGLATWLRVVCPPSALPGCRSHSGPHLIILLPGDGAPLLCLEVLRRRDVSSSVFIF